VEHAVPAAEGSSSTKQAAAAILAAAQGRAKGKGKANAGQGGGGAGGSSGKTPAGVSGGQGSSSKQAGGQRSVAQRSTVEDVAAPGVQLPALPPNPTSGTPQEMQAARKERQRVRKIREAMLREASEAQ
jgi:hypothetical protein